MKKEFFTSNQPLVSIYIPTKNRSDLLNRAVHSIINQTYKNIEIIIIDDNSDKIHYDKIVENFSLCSKIKILRNETTMGACKSRNKAIKNSNGIYITGCDDDDYFDSFRIESLMRKWQDLEKIGANFSGIYSNCIYISNSGELKVARKNYVGIDKISQRNYVGNQVLTKKIYFDLVGGFSEEMPAWQDHELWYRLIRDIGPMYSSLDFTYFVDESHSENRISQSFAPKILAAYKTFTLLHSLTLTEKEKNLLYLSYLNYPQVKFNLSHFFSSIKYFNLIAYLKVFLQKNT